MQKLFTVLCQFPGDSGNEDSTRVPSTRNKTCPQEWQVSGEKDEGRYLQYRVIAAIMEGNPGRKGGGGPSELVGSGRRGGGAGGRVG